jgi:hypothetical protein
MTISCSGCEFDNKCLTQFCGYEADCEMANDGDDEGDKDEPKQY